MNDEEAVRRCQNGDREAFRHLVDQYKNVLYGTACLMTGNPSAAEDQVQEALISAWRGIGGFRNGRPVKPWLVRILVNTVMGQRRRRSIATEPLGDNPQQAALDDPAEAAETAETRQWVRRAIASLSGEHRQVVILRYFSDLTVPQVAHVLGCRQGTVKSRLHRAIQRLRHELREEQQESGEDNEH